MDTLELIGATLGLSFVTGLRLYATVLALGLAIHFGKFHPSHAQEPLRVLAEWPVLIAAAVAYLAEFLADKIPWIDSVWDSFHTIIRPLGAALLAATVLGSLDPVLKVTLAILCGGVALASHSSKAAARIAINHSPEPFTNIAASLAGDVLAPAGLWLSFTYPLVVMALVTIFLAIFLWLAPKIFRALSTPFKALKNLPARRTSPQPSQTP